MSAALSGRKGGQARMIDWEAIHRRLEAARERAAHGWRPTLEEARRILKARAAALAREPEPPGDPRDALEVIEFALAYERYAVESAHVREVYPLKELTPLPCTPPFVLGIVNVRGQILSVLDLRRFFELPEKGLTDLNKVLILGSEAMEFGVLADAIVGTRLVLQSELRPSLPTLTGIREAYLRGVTGDQMAVLDAAKLLADPKIVVHEQVQG
jgi:purine-binding chemotaxis protein CheW